MIREGRIIACDRVEALAQSNAKRVTLHGNVDPSRLEAVRDLRRLEDGVSFLYGGDLDQLLARLARGRVCDLSVAEPDLEEVFLHYYQEGGAQA